MLNLISTADVSELIGVPAQTILSAIWHRRLAAPEKVTNSYLWTAEDVERACLLFHNSPLEQLLMQQAGTPQCRI